jgi:hypothetical protein
MAITESNPITDIDMVPEEEKQTEETDGEPQTSPTASLMGAIRESGYALRMNRRQSITKKIVDYVD